MIRQFGRYEVLHKLGQGAMSAVFLSRDPMLSRLAAVKVLHSDLLYQPAVLARFFKEAKTVSRVSSPNVVQVLDFGMEGRIPFLVMEFIDGQTLQKIMNQLSGDPMPSEVAAAIVLQIADGLAATAEAGIVHRDLKPDNLLMSRKGMIKISDFGICHLKDHTMTATGQVLGSPRFMSPEQVKGVKPLTAQSDLFSLGSVFYYLLTGSMPFQSDFLPELYKQIAEQPHVPVANAKPSLDKNLGRLVDSLLEKNPIKREQDAAQVAAKLRKYLHKRKVLDPIGRISEYVLRLSESGVQTTSNLSPEQVRLWLGSLELDSALRKKPTRKLLGLLLGATVALGTIILGLVVWFVKPKPHTVIRQAQKTQEQPIGVIGSLSEHLPDAKVRNKTADWSEKVRPPVTIPLGEPSKHQDSPYPETMPSAILTIQSTPPFAEVEFDGYELGRTPLEGKSCPIGRHRLTLRSRIGRDLDTNVYLKEGRQTFRFVLLENPAVSEHEETDP